MPKKTSPLALLGGKPLIAKTDPMLYKWPIITKEDETAVLAVLRAGAMSGTNITMQFEKEFAAWQGTRYALAYCNGTAALQGAMFGAGLGSGDEIIAPSLTYWATILPALSLRAVPVFADIKPDTLTLDPADAQRHITPRTRAIIVNHQGGHPADMDELVKLARKYKIKLIEDVSHAQGGKYRGRKLGTFGDVAAMSLMAGKSLVAGEGGMLVTDDRHIFERAVMFGHYERTYHDQGFITDPKLSYFAPLPMGGYKHRLNQIASALGRVQLKYYDQRAREIRRAMNYFWDQLKGLPGLHEHRVNERTGSTMGGWYCPMGRYNPDELGKLPAARFVAAVAAEGAHCGQMRRNLFALHTHPLLVEADIYHEGRPTIIANANGIDTRQTRGNLPVSEIMGERIVLVPWFKHFRPEAIKQQARAYRKVAEHYQDLLEPGRR